MSLVTKTSDSLVFLDDVDWQTYEKLRGAAGNRNIRMTYDEGLLILMSPSKLHERIAELLARMIIVWTEEFGIPLQSCGAMTFKRQDLQKGFEPDKCYYIQNESQVRNRDELDLTVDPPPDLAIEVDVFSSSASRVPLYAVIGVLELWRWEDEAFTVLVLTADRRYEPSDESICLPGFPLPEAARRLGERSTIDETTLLQNFRQWIQQNRLGSSET
jgi:Uma2 family endonuclease